MTTPKRNDQDISSDNWTLHEEQYEEYARLYELRGGKTIHQLVAEANAPKLPRDGGPRRRRSGRGR